MKINNILRKPITYERTFILICLGSLYIYCNYTLERPILLTLSVIVMLVLINVFSKDLVADKKIYENKKSLALFSIIYVFIAVVSILFNKILHLNNYTINNINLIYVFILQAVLISTIFLCYLFGIRLGYYNWNITLKQIGIIVLIYITNRLILNLITIDDKDFVIINLFKFSFVIKFIISTFYHCFYPGFLEEVIYRGFLITGLKGIGCNEWKCNVIQSLLFGILHVFAWGSSSWLFLLSTAYQCLLGFALGKIYFKTKSLTPCIFLHGLLDAI